ncbi:MULTISPECIES: plasmid pRiA4b ORF-3 family protein [Enterobacteriaceae]|uniref:plasmid pRiA4b ORF-3 family protein n=1 Tax=Enterobacteriaceae TaxID=543 RepID=UPI0004DB098B|nr:MULTISPECIES: plasmid pRiA4b ORF-3 family protein [Enterobacteriaceae]KEM56277.1 plasmid pRiA4b ORF-3-like family protein [Escherichia coli 6-319-05_S3_C3]MCV0911461.1 plasmid pRiA4b ORF-3 family protein [Escherichia coli]MDN0037593.1 plasmid pRiA4b ORF-3 family protein [Escherichia coli]
MVWRRLRIAADTSLAALYFIIQIIQGWGDDHLHQFHIYGITYEGALVFRITRSRS